MASKQGRKRRVTDDDLAKIWRDYQEGGYGLVAKGTGFSESYVRALVKRARAIHAQEPPPTPKRKGKRPQPTTLTKAIGRYIQECRELALNGRKHTVMLGGLPGFPNATDDPKVVERAIAMYQARAVEPGISVIKELKTRQRIMDLRAGIEWLGYEAEASEDRATFMAWGAEWADEQGISYGAFRDMGVPAADLKEAGITR